MPKIVDHDQRRAEYVAALWKVVETQGAAAVSIRSVAAAAGTSKSNVMYYFPTRGRLLAAAVDGVMDEGIAVGRRAIETGLTVDGAVKALLHAVPTTPVRRRQAEVWQLLNVERTVDPELSSLLDEFNDRVRHATSVLLRNLVASGIAAPGSDSDLEVDRLHALVDGLSLQSMANPRRMSRARVEEILRAHVDSLAPG